MNYSHKTALVAVALLGIANNAFGHIYSYSNHTNKTVQIRMQLGGIGEPWYYLGPNPYRTKSNPNDVNNRLRSNTTHEFRFVAGQGPLDYSRKFGFCLARQQYRIFNPRTGQFNAWRAIATKFLETDLYNKMVDASSKFAEGAVSTAAKIAQSAGGKAAIAGGVAEQVPIASIVQSVGKMVGYSMCRERHFDVVEGTDGMEFISLAE